MLWFGTNPLTTALGLAAILFYVVLYTLILKRRTAQNIVWGGIAGCMPVLIAWAAVTNKVEWPAVILFLIIFLWTPPHYWPLSMKYARRLQRRPRADARRDFQRPPGLRAGRPVRLGHVGVLAAAGPDGLRRHRLHGAGRRLGRSGSSTSATCSTARPSATTSRRT